MGIMVYSLLWVTSIHQTLRTPELSCCTRCRTGPTNENPMPAGSELVLNSNQCLISGRGGKQLRKNDVADSEAEENLQGEGRTVHCEDDDVE